MWNIWRGHYYHQITLLPNWLLIPQHIFSIPNPFRGRLARWIQAPQFIYWAFMHHPSAEVLTCLLIPLHIVSISYWSKCWPARWIQVPQFIYWTFLPPHSTDLPTYSPTYFPYFLLIQVPICWHVRWVQVLVHLSYISTSSKCQPADLSTCLLLLPVCPIIFLIQPDFFCVY